MLFIVYGEQATNSLLHFKNNRLVMQRMWCSFLYSMFSKSELSSSGLHCSRSVSYKAQLCTFCYNSNANDFCNARLPSRGWCIPRRVGSDLWYRDMIAWGAVAFSRRTLGCCFTFSRRTKDHSQTKSNCKDVNVLSESKEKIQQINCVLTL